jgi:hypothetical protein
MIRRVALAGILTAGLLAPLAITTPVGAGSDIGCSGNDCSISLSRSIKLWGTATNGSWATPTPIPVTPPPCLWAPIGDALTGSQYIIQNFGAMPPNSYFDITQSVQLAKKLLKENPPPAGTWYELPTNPAASPAAQQQCRQLPLFFFDRPGQALPAVPISPEWLADYAYNHMRIPAPSLKINPQNKGYVNLATYLWAAWPGAQQNGSVAYYITAQLGAQIVTVWARATSFRVDVTGPGTAYSAGCAIKTGSHYPTESPPANAGPGTPPDCGVLWQAPTAGATITATVTWNVTWGQGQLTSPGPQALPPLTTSRTRQPPLRVVEIQSINGG